LNGVASRGLGWAWDEDTQVCSSIDSGRQALPSLMRRKSCNCHITGSSGGQHRREGAMKSPVLRKGPELWGSRMRHLPKKLQNSVNTTWCSRLSRRRDCPSESRVREGAPYCLGNSSLVGSRPLKASQDLVTANCPPGRLGSMVRPHDWRWLMATSPCLLCTWLTQVCSFSTFCPITAF
jgi:hypothetical protein